MDWAFGGAFRGGLEPLQMGPTGGMDRLMDALDTSLGVVLAVNPSGPNEYWLFWGMDPSDYPSGGVRGAVRRQRRGFPGCWSRKPVRSQC